MGGSTIYHLFIVPRFLNHAAKIESEMAILFLRVRKFSCANSCRYKLSMQATKCITLKVLHDTDT